MATDLAARPDVLVIGAAEGSLGAAVVDECLDGVWDFGKVHTAGISGDEGLELNVLRSARIAEVLAETRPDVVVCTVGVNEAGPATDPYLPTRMADAFSTNVIGPMDVLRHFAVSPQVELRGHAKKFVAISSNSARIPRRNSMAYCASKAALSMALRVAARELAGSGMVVWGYEPGLLAGTPMTKRAEAAFSGLPALHRMKGVDAEGIPTVDLAARIVQDIATLSVAYNGVIFPFDAGEL